MWKRENGGKKKYLQKKNQSQKIEIQHWKNQKKGK
jgi:hypothetical protein